MTHHHPESKLTDSVMQLLAEHGLDYLSEAIRVLLNEAMKVERARALGAQPYERNAERRG